MNQLTDENVPRLAVYGSLAPGRPNHGQLAGIPGRWFAGIVQGHLHAAGWGSALGFPGLVLGENGEDVEVQIFESQSLRAEWPRLDAFEGPEYRRVNVDARIAEGSLPVHIYVLSVAPERSVGN